MEKDDNRFKNRQDKPYPKLFEDEGSANPFSKKASRKMDSASGEQSRAKLQLSLIALALISAFALILILLFPGMVSRAFGAAGDLLLDLNRPHIAMQSLNLAVLLSPKDPYPHNKRAEAEMSLDDYQAAIADLTTALKTDTSGPSSETLANRGVCFFKVLKLNEALSDLDNALKIDPSNVEALISRGEVNSHLGHYDRSLADFGRASRLDPSNVLAKNAWQETFDLQYEETMEKTSGNTATTSNKPHAITPIVRTRPHETAITLVAKSDWERAHVKGLKLLADGESKTAVAEFDKAIKLKPSYVESYVKRGIAYFKMKDYPNALTSFSDAITLDNQDATKFYCRALTYDRMNQSALAAADLKQASQLDPAHARMYSKFIEVEAHRQ